MGKQKKNKDKKDKKKNKDKDRDRQKERERERKDKKKKEKKRSYSSSSSSSDSSDSSSSSRSRTKKKDSKNKKKQRKQVKPQIKSTNNPYDFDKNVPKAVPSFPVGLPAPGFSVPIMHPTPPPPTTAIAPAVIKPKTKEIHIFKLLPKLPYGAVLFGKTLYSTQFIQQKSYDILLTEMIDQIDKKVKQENHKKAINIITKCSGEIQKIINAEQERKKNSSFIENSSNQQIIPHEQILNQENNRFTNLKKIYDQYFQE